MNLHLLYAGVSGPIQFDSFGDLVPQNTSYVSSQFDIPTASVRVKGLI
jgi:hypothetical protein